AYSSSRYCWKAGALRQWVTSFSRFWPLKREAAAGFSVNSTRIGGKAQTSCARRVMPRGESSTGSVSGAAPCRASVPLTAFSEVGEPCAKDEIGPLRVKWIISLEANSGLGGEAAAALP